jgi:carbon-monoxide dehydrogenase large subunit
MLPLRSRLAAEARAVAEWRALNAATPYSCRSGDNLVFQRVNESGDVADAFRSAHKVVEATFHSGRHTGVTLEPRSILVEFNKGDATLTVHHATQAPHMIQEVLAQHLRLPLSAVRVICRDVGGSYGIKVHVYPDEVAVAVIAKLMGRPVKFVADRLESFASDIHARDHRIKGRMAIDRDGRITAFDIDDRGHRPTGVPAPARGGNQVVNLVGRAPTSQLSCQDYGRAAEQGADCQYRAVGHPIATAATGGW